MGLTALNSTTRIPGYVMVTRSTTGKPRECIAICSDPLVEA